MPKVRLDVFTSVYSFWILLDCLSFVFLTPVGGQIEVIESLIIAAPGDDIVLKCLVDPKADLGSRTVEWSKLGLKENPADPLYVYVYRNRREDVVLMCPSYVGRTKLFTEALKDGNILLLIKNVTLTDNGQYKCFIPELKQYSIVRLVVDSNYVKMTTTEMPLEPNGLRTLEPTTDMGVKGQRHHLIPIIVVVIILVILGPLGYLFMKLKAPTLAFLLLAVSTTRGLLIPKLIRTPLEVHLDLNCLSPPCFLASSLETELCQTLQSSSNSRGQEVTALNVSPLVFQ